jgi:hypothetical protein
VAPRAFILLPSGKISRVISNGRAVVSPDNCIPFNTPRAYHLSMEFLEYIQRDRQHDGDAHYDHEFRCELTAIRLGN